MSPDALLELERQRCALISEGFCPECKLPLARESTTDGTSWASCGVCAVAYRASGTSAEDWSTESRMIEHWSLDPLAVPFGEEERAQ